MEEILASIRRIIADEDAGKMSPPPPQPRPLAAAPLSRAAQPVSAQPMKQEEIGAMLELNKPTGSGPEKLAPVLDLTEAMTAAPRAEGFRTIEAPSDMVVEDNAAAMPRGPGERPLMSALTSAAVDSAFNSLAHTVLVQNARTLEDLVREMLRPLLRTWLDDNLPRLVERLVRAEIERVSRGRS